MEYKILSSQLSLMKILKYYLKNWVNSLKVIVFWFKLMVKK